MRRSPAPSSTHLFTEARRGFPAHGFAPDQPSPLLPTHNPVPGPVPEGFMNEPPPHPDPVPGSVLEGFMNEPPPHSDPVPGGSWMNRLHTPILFLILLRRCPKPSRPHTLFLSVRGSWMDCLHSLFLSLRGARTHPLRLLCFAEGLHGLAEGPSGLRTAPLSSTVGSPGPAAGRQIIGSYISGLLIACPYVAGLLIVCPYVAGPLIIGSARDSNRSSRLNSGPASDGLWASLRRTQKFSYFVIKKK
ncbi:hypothetical protein AMECASPLE_000157 [Ameca splendens]|uniref:Uncharacterized protein n=1 Tax=Ameca splendens TaxID=208324 RepID=A0ABV0YVP7_9TELE